MSLAVRNTAFFQFNRSQSTQSICLCFATCFAICVGIFLSLALISPPHLIIYFIHTHFKPIASPIVDFNNSGYARETAPPTKETPDTYLHGQNENCIFYSFLTFFHTFYLGKTHTLPIENISHSGCKNLRFLSLQVTQDKFYIRYMYNWHWN